MQIVTQIPTNNDIGGKARQLFNLEKLGFNVPAFLAIPVEVLNDVTQGSKDINDTRARIAAFRFPEYFIQNIFKHFKGVKHFAVRSSATDEDGSKHSFAGQFESFLYVSPEQLEESIKAVWLSAFSDRVVAYRAFNKLSNNQSIAVIVQEMLPADISGVAFGANPINGATDEKLINAVWGLGEGLVSGRLNADTYHVTNAGVELNLADKTSQFALDKDANIGTKMYQVPDQLHKAPTLNQEKISAIVSALDTLQKAFSMPQDIEFAFADEVLYLLQTRPITTNLRIEAEQDNYILWDNSNIIESYPGVTTPLTFSFISHSYDQAYKAFVGFMGVSPHVIKQNERLFSNTLGLLNGRVYYNLKTWYQMLALLPGYSINARFMEKMMGVKERFDIPETHRLSKGQAWWQILKMIVKMYSRYRSLPTKRKSFVSLLEQTIQDFKQKNLSELSTHELLQIYYNLELKLLNEWKAPLLNDFFAMIWFGILQKRTTKYNISSNPNIHNDLLCGSSDIVSTQPIHRSIALATEVSNSSDLKQLFTTETSKTVWDYIQNSKEPDAQKLLAGIQNYINDFGERCIGELKLETISYTQDPTHFIAVLQAYVSANITLASISGSAEITIRNNAESAVDKALRGKPIKKWLLKNAVSKARELVSARENLRYERTRAFGMVREIFTHIGYQFYKQGIVENARDIFYLGKEEIFAFVEGRAISQDIKGTIEIRKHEFSAYQLQQPTGERLATYGIVYAQNDFFKKQTHVQETTDLTGIGCCPGVVRSKVRVVTDPKAVTTLNGDILVTSSTDPGWVTLFPSAGGIVVERGSLLSHSAIVSREMGIPCIVSVTGLLQRLKTGDLIEMNGSTGQIKILEQI